MHASLCSADTYSPLSCKSHSAHNSSLLHISALQTAEEFQYELFCGTDEMREVLPNSVELSLVRQTRGTSGLVILVFNIRFNPFKTME